MFNSLAVGVQKNADQAVTTARGGKEGAQVVQHLHGKYYETAARGNVFVASTLAAGIVVPFIAATMTSKFTLVNPAASGMVAELIDINVLQVPGSALITGLGVAFQGPLATTGGYPGTLTTSTGQHQSTLPYGGQTTPLIHYSSAVLTNVAIANLTPIIWLFNNVATTVITQQYVNYQFDGKFILPPDSLMCLCNSITGTQSAAAISVTYALYPQ
jgi:hypothetical protein